MEKIYEQLMQQFLDAMGFRWKGARNHEKWSK